MSAPSKRGPLTLSRIYAQCAKRGDCRVWNGCVTSQGYAYVYDPALHQATRTNGMRTGRVAVWQLATGAPPPHGQRIVMTCRNKLCLAHAHMQLMSIAESNAFAAEAGAYRSLKQQIANVANGRHSGKLDSSKAAAIREAVLVAGASHTSQAELYGVHLSTISEVVRGKTWAQRSVPNASVFNMVA